MTRIKRLLIPSLALVVLHAGCGGPPITEPPPGDPGDPDLEQMKGTWTGTVVFPWVTWSARLVVNSATARSGQIVGFLVYTSQNQNDCGKTLVFKEKTGSTVVVQESETGRPVFPCNGGSDGVISLTFDQATGTLGFDWSDAFIQVTTSLSR